MNFSQLHERLRIEVLRRIDSGSLTAALLAHRTGFAPAHISNFLNRKRRLSLDALDKVLQSESLTIGDLFPGSNIPPVGAGRAAAAMHYDFRDRDTPIKVLKTVILSAVTLGPGAALLRRKAVVEGSSL